MFPQLRVLEYHLVKDSGLLTHLKHYLHDGLSRFVVNVDSDITNTTRGRENICLAFDDLGCACENIKNYAIHVYPYHRDIREAFIELMEKSRSLEVLWLRPGMLTSEAMKVLSKLPNLKRQFIGTPTDYEISSSEDAFDSPAVIDSIEDISFDPEPDVEHFPSIIQLDVQTRITSLVKMISQHDYFRRLRNLYIDTIEVEAVLDAKNCFQLLSSTCPDLRLLTLTQALAVRLGGQHRSAANESKVFTYDLLKPLESMPKLDTFTLEHEYPLVISNDDLLNFIKNCPNLTALRLNQECTRSFPENSPGPTFDVLHRIAPIRPMMRVLAISVKDVADSVIQASLKDAIASSITLRSLTKLKFGKSSISKTRDALQYLSQLLPSSCVVSPKEKWETRLDSSFYFTDLLREGSKQRERFERQNQLIEQLEREIKDLRTKLVQSPTTTSSLSHVVTEAAEGNK